MEDAVNTMNVILKVTSYGREFLPIVAQFNGYAHGVIVIDDRGKTHHIFFDETDIYKGEFQEGKYYRMTSELVRALRKEYKDGIQRTGKNQ